MSDPTTNPEQKVRLFGSIGSGDLLRQAALIIVLTICIAIAVSILLWTQESDMRPLGKMPMDELIQTLEFLDTQKIEYELDGNVIYVPIDTYQNIKLLMAKEGLDQAPSSGTDILMQDMGFGVSQRLERERLKHSREQQLARAIEELSQVAQSQSTTCYTERKCIRSPREKAQCNGCIND